MSLGRGGSMLKCDGWDACIFMRAEFFGISLMRMIRMFFNIVKLVC